MVPLGSDVLQVAEDVHVTPENKIKKTFFSKLYLKVHSDYNNSASTSIKCSALQLIVFFSIFTAMRCISCWSQQNSSCLNEP